jgi:hypothetical protein
MTEEAVLPLQTVLFQLIFLLVAIALEARVLYRRLRISRRTSIEYAISINLLSTVIGWLTFFIIQNLAPLPVKTQMISYVFFDRLLSPQPANLHLVIAATGVVMFFAAFLIKLKGLQLLEALLQRSPQPETSPTSEQGPRLGLPARLEQAAAHTDPNQAAVVLLANAYSHSAILVLLLLRYLHINPLR